jgi:pyruvyltransferase
MSWSRTIRFGLGRLLRIEDRRGAIVGRLRYYKSLIMKRVNTFKKRLFLFKRKLTCTGIVDSFRTEGVVVRYWDFEPNWGDSINEFIFSSVLGEKVYSANAIFNFRNREVITGIGSVLSGSLLNFSIWGSGYLSEGHRLVNPPNTLLALRGELSRKKIKDAFAMDTDILGDPGLLFSEYYNPNPLKKFKVGIIPHFKEEGDKIVNDIRSYYGPDINIISPRLDIFEFANQVKMCEKILSSSLHGLVLAEAYGIPTARITISDKVIGGDFKFIDYYSGVGIKYDKISSGSLHELWESRKILSPTSDLKELSFSKNALVDSLRYKFQNP